MPPVALPATLDGGTSHNTGKACGFPSLVMSNRMAHPIEAAALASVGTQTSRLAQRPITKTSSGAAAIYALNTIAQPEKHQSQGTQASDREGHRN